MNILDNELVRKYFGCEYELSYPHGCAEARTFRILRAMEEPIKKGERYLEWIYESPDSNIKEDNFEERTCRGISGTSTLGQIEEFFDRFHPRELRLPDRFQKPKGMQYCTCENMGVTDKHSFDGKPCRINAIAYQKKCPVAGCGCLDLVPVRPTPEPEWPETSSGLMNKAKRDTDKCVGKHGIMCSCMANSIKPKDEVEKCECGSCGRNHSFDLSPCMTKPKDEPEKCKGHAFSGGVHDGPCPPVEVEEFIGRIENFFRASDPRKDYAQKHLSEELRELVALARKNV